MVTLLWACGPAAPPAVEADGERVVRGPSGVRAVVDADRVELRAPTRVLGGDRSVRLVGAVHVGDPAYYAAVDAFLAPCAAVLYEGLAPDPGAPPPPDDDVALALDGIGMVFQRDALRADGRFVRVDRTVAEVRSELLATPEGAAHADAWLVDRDREALRGVLGAARGDDHVRHVVRLSMIRGLARPGERGDAWWDVVIGGRDRVVVDAVLDAPGDGPVCVVYGADHLPDLEARLVRRGFRVESRGELPVVTVALADVGLGPVQARQLLER